MLWCIQEQAFLQQQVFLIFVDHPVSGPFKSRAKQLPSRTSLRSHAVWEGLTTPITSTTLTARNNDHRTGRLCEADGCCGELESSVVHFGESMPWKEVKLAWEHTNKADLALVLGSSLKVAPARVMPVQVAKKGGHLVIVNFSALVLTDRPLW